MKERLKNLKISEITHKKLKIYCAINGLKINDFVNSVIINKIEKSKHEKKLS